MQIIKYVQLQEWLSQVALLDDGTVPGVWERIYAEIEEIPWETMQQCITWIRQCVTDAFLRVKHWPLEPSQGMG